MSYEGYEQVLCANGHLSQFDCWSTVELNDSEDLCHCGAPYVFMHSVDETNGYGEPIELACKEPEVRETCNMGHSHVTKEATYYIPIRKRNK